MTESEPKRTLVINTIENGTVIDHIRAGEALTVLRILGITGSTRERVSVATNVTSKAHERKDVVKIEKRELKANEVDRIALVAPNATINIPFLEPVKKIINANHNNLIMLPFFLSMR